MNDLSHDVKIWGIRARKGARGTGYVVRWLVAGEPFQDTFSKRAQADAFRSQLLTAARKGEGFSAYNGLPKSLVAKAATVNWYEFAIKYADRKWDSSAATTRRTTAKILARTTIALLPRQPTKVDPDMLRRALISFAFNKLKREQASSSVEQILRSVKRLSPTMAVWEAPDRIDGILAKIYTRLDGKPVAHSHKRLITRHLKLIFNYATECGVLSGNPIPKEKGRVKPKPVDKRSLVNRVVAGKLLDEVRDYRPNGETLHGYLATMYFAGLRPEEVSALVVGDVILPAEDADDQWGELVLHRAAPLAGRGWTNSGDPYDERQLKGRDEGDTRVVPCHPDLTTILREHVRGKKPGQLVFTGVKGGRVSPTVIGRAWDQARKAVLSAAEYASLLGKRPYDLRHTCLTTWLNNGAPPARVAYWAGNSVPVLLMTYVHCVEGEFEQLKARLESAQGALRAS
ncbi:MULTISPECIES: tyrosine-type recombinase/integrase [Streptomycetaceae]|uniref:tyrosine-type recombinase/integrase n=1 Tax=Streptomycetaceae TaxID=2062 RepID=UPI0012FFA5C2|nr:MULTISPECIES: tyrosine-type recombinase/integrase [Streptomycetaceae]MYS57639.1 tyrosine-type recombinase/integrase [Streptomyces sp. SID5468]